MLLTDRDMKLKVLDAVMTSSAHGFHTPGASFPAFGCDVQGQGWLGQFWHQCCWKMCKINLCCQ